MGWAVNATPRPFYPWERAGTPCIGDWIDLRSGLDRYEKYPVFNPRSVQPVESRYTDYAFPGLTPTKPPLQGVPGLS